MSLIHSQRVGTVYESPSKNSADVRKYEGAFRRRVHKQYTRRKTPSSYQSDEFLFEETADAVPHTLYSAGYCVNGSGSSFTGRIDSRTGRTFGRIHGTIG